MLKIGKVKDVKSDIGINQIGINFDKTSNGEEITIPLTSLLKEPFCNLKIKKYWTRIINEPVKRGVNFKMKSFSVSIFILWNKKIKVAGI